MADRSITTYLRANVTDFNRQIGSASKSLEQLTTKADGTSIAAGTAMGRLTQSAQLQREAWTTVGAGLTAFGAVTVAALGASVKAAIDWESAWAGVQKTVDGSASQMAALEDGLRGMARELPATHSEIAAVAEAAGALGVKTKDVEGFTRTMVMLGETTNLTADEAATAIAQISNVMGTMERDGAAGVERFGAALVQLGNNGASTEREILDMAARISATASVIGMSESDVLGYANALASVGINAEAGGSAISRVFMDIASAASSGGEELTAFANVAGMSAQDFARAFEEDPARAVATFIQGLGGISAAGGDVFGVLSDLGMSDIRVSQALLTMAQSGDLLTESLDMGAAAWEENSALQDEFAKRLETTQAQMEIARNNIADAGISLGSVFLPAIADASGAVAGFAGTIADMPAPVQGLIGGLGGLAGAASLAAGSFLLLFPRAMDTVTAMRDLGIVGPNANKILGGTVSAVGRLAAWGGAVGITAVALVAVANAVKTDGVVRDAEALADEIIRIAGAGRTLKEVGLGSVFEEMPTFLGMSTIEATNLKGVFDNLLDPSLTDRASRFFGEMGLPSYMKDTEEAAKAADEALVSMLNAGGSNASMAVALIEGLGYSAEELATVLPGVAELLDQTGAASENAAGGVQIAGESFGTANEALEEFLENAGDAGAKFGGLLDAYQSVIDKNKEIAEETASATKSSKDSWEDFYDGTTVSMGDWLAALDEQIAAVTSWRENAIRAGEQIRDEMPEHMREAAAATVRALIEAGPEGAAALAAFVNGSEDDRKAIIEKQGQLGNNAGVATAEAFEQALNQVEPAEIPVEVTADTGPALYALDGVILAIDESTGTFTIDGNPVPAVTTLSTLMALVGQSAEDITINGNPLPANVTLGQLLGLIRESEEPVTIGGNNAKGATALAGLLGLIARSEEDVKVDADTAKATNTTNNWRPLKTAYINVDADLSSAKYTVSNWRPGTKYADVIYTPRGGGMSFSPGKVGGPIADGLIEGRRMAFRGGGAIYGPGSGTSDDVIALGPRPDVQYRLSNGEHVWTDAEVKSVGGHAGVYALRAMARSGALAGVLGFADGGSVAAPYRPAPAGYSPAVNVGPTSLVAYVENPWTGEQVRAVVRTEARNEMAQAASPAQGARRRAGGTSGGW